MGVRRHRLMEGRVEHHDVRRTGKEAHRLLYASDVARIVQRREGRTCAKFGHDVIAGDDRLHECRTAMYGAVADGGDLCRISDGADSR